MRASISAGAVRGLRWAHSAAGGWSSSGAPEQPADGRHSGEALNNPSLQALG